MHLFDILRQHRLFGYPDPSWYIWAAGRIVQQVSADSGALPKQQGLALHTALCLLRQATVLSPYDRDTHSMLERLQSMVRAPDSTLAFSRFAAAAAKPLELRGQAEAVKRVDRTRNDPERVLGALAAEPPMDEAYLLLLELWRMGEREAFLSRAEAFSALPGGAAAGPALALGAWRAGEPELAMRLAEAAPANYLTRLMQAEQALEAGDADAARAHWRLSLKLEPLQPTLVLKLAESLAPAPAPSLVDEARVHVGFYTYNKLQMTLDTLSSLLDSHIGAATVSLINNGSTEFSHEELAAGVARTAQGRQVELIELPVNIGAPAARNWLRHLPATSEADYLAYLDDDVFLPRDWLAHYLQDLRETPGAVVAGPLCLNPNPMGTVQYIWRYFEEIGDHKIRFSNNCPQFMNFGQYASRRPCLSVMGCCHLFDVARMDELALPDFDIRFSPSQVDDLEHDLQVWKAGGKVVYDGRVQVVHRQDAGRQAMLSRPALGNVFGNHRKMEAKFSGHDLHEVQNRVLAEDDAHFARCLDATRPMLPEIAASLLATYRLAPEPDSRES